MMLFAFIGLFFVIIFFLIVQNRVKSAPKSTFWIILLFFSGACGLFSVVIRESIRPYMRYRFGHETDMLFLLIEDLIASFFHYSLPYFLLLFSISYSNILEKHTKYSVSWLFRLALALLLPIIFMYLFFPVHPYFNPRNDIKALWQIPYTLISLVLLASAYFYEKNIKLKQQNFLICIIIFPEIIFTSFTNMILPLYGIEGIYKYDPYVLAVTFSLFAFFAIRYNVMGTKLIIRLEHQHYKNARQSLSSGTAILNHAIKNELIKISLCTENMMSTDSFKKENGKAILESVDYLLDFTARIQDKLSDKALVEKKCSFEQLVTKPLEMLQPILRQKNISVNLNLGSNIDLYCDELHIHEVIKNIVTNSAEAMAANEKIDIKTYFNKNHFTISIMDTGKGIPKEYLSRVIEPFFTTKKSSLNFGLGLSYCYNIMHQHGGALEIFSKENSGTTVLLIFPISRVSKLYYIDKNRRLA